MQHPQRAALVAGLGAIAPSGTVDGGRGSGVSMPLPYLVETKRALVGP
jgi:hypothetical protein